MIVTTADISDVWHIVKAGLDIVKQESGADWEPWQVYDKVRHGEWLLVMIGAKHFTIFSIEQNQYTDEKYIIIQATYAPCSGAPDKIAFYDNLAREIGCAYIETVSRRKGLERSGFQLQDMTFRRRVQWEK